MRSSITQARRVRSCPLPSLPHPTREAVLASWTATERTPAASKTTASYSSFGKFSQAAFARFRIRTAMSTSSEAAYLKTRKRRCSCFTFYGWRRMYAVLLFSNLNNMFVGYFDPVNTTFDSYNRSFSGWPNSIGSRLQEVVQLLQLLWMISNNCRWYTVSISWSYRQQSGSV